jgi:hypothetical protein
MNKNTRNLVGGIMLIAGAYFVYRYFKGAKPKVQKPVELSDFSNPPSPSIPSSFPLKKGSKGAKVLELQKAIMSINPKLLPKFGADGDFGSETELAVSRMLGKKTIDSQADIETIKKGKTSKARG